MSNVLFELPLHPIGEKRVAILSISDTLYQTVNLDALGLDFLPEVLILDNCRYRYAGIEYGRGVYRKEDEVPPTESPFPQDSESWTDAFDDYDDYLDDISESLAQAIQEVSARELVDVTQCSCDCSPEEEYGVAQSPPDPASVLAPVHNDLHNPAYMQCERCRVLAEKLSEMLENPPGFGGIKVDEEFYGNKYIDFGWQEAVRVVQSLIVPCSDGTIEETASSLVENEELP